jgi:hypothetical protein
MAMPFILFVIFRSHHLIRIQKLRLLQFMHLFIMLVKKKRMVYRWSNTYWKWTANEQKLYYFSSINAAGGRSAGRSHKRAAYKIANHSNFDSGFSGQNERRATEIPGGQVVRCFTVSLAHPQVAVFPDLALPF